MVDIGAYESVTFADCNGNGVPDVDDIASGTSDDCNGNLVPDDCELASGSSADCNGNGIPDECDVICDVDIVFVLDTSGSMEPEIPLICTELIGGVDSMLDPMIEGDVSITVFGITATAAGCTFNGTVAGTVGDTVPGDWACTCVLDVSDIDEQESWGAATAIVADQFGWNDGALRVVVPVSDEGSCRGEPENTLDDASVQNAIDIARDAVVVAFPVTGLGANSTVEDLAIMLAMGTGGRAFIRDDVASYGEIAISLVNQIVARSDQACDDSDGDGFPDACGGACCLPDTTCMMMPETMCTLLGGTFLGSRATCTTTACGACCLASACAVTTKKSCWLQGGGWQGAGVECDAACEFLGACCLAEGGCVVTYAGDCTDEGDVFYLGTDCGAGSLCP